MDIIEQMKQDFDKFISKWESALEKYKETTVKVKMATEEDVGKLCFFWDDPKDDGSKGVLKWILNKDQYKYVNQSGFAWNYCRRLTPSEVEEITGYNVEERQ